MKKRLHNLKKVWIIIPLFIVAVSFRIETVVGQELTADPAIEEMSEQEPDSQPVEDDDQSLSNTQLILRRERLTEEISDQHKQLLGQLTAYQQDERQYRIALDQYQRLQTLKSIEEIVEISRKLILSRNKALHSYLNLLRLQIIESEGIEQKHKTRIIEQVEALQIQLTEHSNLAQEISDRERVNQLAEEFEPLAESVSTTSYYALSILAIGRLQSVYDQAVVINQRIREKDEQSQIESSARMRSLAEVEKLINELPSLNRTVWTRVDEAESSYQSYEGLYRNLSRDLNSIYSKLSRLVSYFEELENVE